MHYLVRPSFIKTVEKSEIYEKNCRQNKIRAMNRVTLSYHTWAQLEENQGGAVFPKAVGRGRGVGQMGVEFPEFEKQGGVL